MKPEIAVAELPSRQFDPRIYGVGAWTDNLHFAYDLVATLKPRLFVELGTDRGESYFGFCQSVAENNTGTRCFAVDTWQGDEQAGNYDETTFREVSAHNDAHYAAFSKLLRGSFDDALPGFEPESIDLLHLDGLHTEEAVGHDVQAWMPKLRPGGVFLIHDVNVRSHGFGVWKVWDELRRRGRSYTFRDGPGLGVWQKPPSSQLPFPVEDLLQDDGAARNAIAEHYRSCARHLQQRIAQHWRDGTIRDAAAGQQTIIQVFYSRDGAHREEDSLLARIGHEGWKEVSMPLPEGAGAAPIRIDFVSPCTVIDVAEIRLTSAGETIFSAANAEAFERVRVSGDAERRPHPRYLRVKITGIDPQLFLPPMTLGTGEARLSLRLRVSVDEPPAD